MSAPEPSSTGGALRRVAAWSWPRSFPLVQFPNPPLALALAASVAGRVTEDGAHRTARAVFYLAFGAWAYDELRHGENWFRRLLGAGASLYLLAELSSALHS